MMEKMKATEGSEVNMKKSGPGGGAIKTDGRFREPRTALSNEELARNVPGDDGKDEG